MITFESKVLSMKSLLLFTSFLMFFSCGLRYIPQPTPESTQLDRRNLIERTIESEFKSQNKVYQPIGYGETVKIKPVSFIQLDSLFEQKYQLERVGKRDAQLEETIKLQQIVCQNDTNEILYLERHVFTLEGDSAAEILSGDFYINL